MAGTDITLTSDGRTDIAGRQPRFLQSSCW